jgi:hypothetical protein
MAGNQSSLTGSLLASVLIHASILSAPIEPFGLVLKGPGRLEVRLQPVPQMEAEGANPAVSRDHSLQTESAQPITLPPTELAVVEIDTPLIEQTAPVETSSGRGSDSAVLLSVVTIPMYLRSHELTRKPILKRPVLREEPGRLYPVSDSLLLVRINERGQVDDVILVATNHPEMAAEAVKAFRQAEYFPGMVAYEPAKVELVIQVLSSGASFLIKQ